MNKLRALILRKQFSAKDLILSAGEIAVVETALIKPVTSRDLVRDNGVSSQQACNMLAKLKKKGYLESKEIHVKGNMPYQSYSVPKALRTQLKIAEEEANGVL